MLAFFPLKGFLGTGAPFGADLNLVVQLIMGSSVDRECSFRQTKTLHSSRYLPDDGVALEFVDDRIGDVAVVPATSKASAS